MRYIDTTNPCTVQESCTQYIMGRRSSYEFRSIRYSAVFNTLLVLGLTDFDTITDVGAGDGEFGRFLREQGFNGEYIAIDGLIDGTDLNVWQPRRTSEFFTSIEVIEHLRSPARLLQILDFYATKGVVITTPNPVVTDVRAMDSTHISEVYPDEFLRAGYHVTPQIFFFEPEDSLLAWRNNGNT